jgi:excisionase family DNA binding protein
MMLVFSAPCAYTSLMESATEHLGTLRIPAKGMERNEFEPLMTVSEVAKYLNMTERAIRHRVRRRVIPFTKVGESLRFRRSDIDGWLTSRTQSVA